MDSYRLPEIIFYFNPFIFVRQYSIENRIQYTANYLNVIRTCKTCVTKSTCSMHVDWTIIACYNPCLLRPVKTCRLHVVQTCKCMFSQLANLLFIQQVKDSTNDLRISLPSTSFLHSNNSYTLGFTTFSLLNFAHNHLPQCTSKDQI